MLKAIYMLICVIFILEEDTFTSSELTSILKTNGYQDIVLMTLPKIYKVQCCIF